MRMQASSSYDPVSEIRLDFPELIRAVMRERRITKTQLRDAGIIRKCTWRCFDDRLDSGEISTREMSALLQYLNIDLVQAVLALVVLKDADEYFEPTCETAAMLAQGLVVSLTQQMMTLEGRFNPLKRGLCVSIAERHATSLIEHQRRWQELEGRDLSLDR